MEQLNNGAIKKRETKVLDGADRKKKRFYQLIADLETALDELTGTVDKASKSLLEFKIDEMTCDYEVLKVQYEIMVEDPLYYSIEDDFRKIRKVFATKMEGFLTKLDEQKESHVSATQENLKIPTFCGQIDEWPVFKEVLQQYENENLHLTNEEKFKMLKSVVQGEAATLIRHLPETNSTYEAAWTILKDKYENKRLIFSTLVDKILDHPTVKFQDAACIKQLVDATKACIKTLKAMKIPMNDADPFIARIVIRKLDSEGLICYNQHVKQLKEVQTLENVLIFLELQYWAKAFVNNNGNGNQLSSPKATNSKKIYCGFCKSENHLLTECSEFKAKPVMDRIKWVKNAKKCKFCLSHPIHKKCFNRNVKCNNCGKQHHTLLHTDENPSVETTQKANINGSTQIKKETKKKTFSQTFVPTAQVKIKSARGDDFIFRALISTGSKRTLISEKAAELLQLPRRKVKTEINFPGSKEISESTIDLQIRPRFESDVVHKIAATVSKKLSITLPNESFDVDMSFWDKYCLADATFNKSDRVDMIIASDLCSQIMQPNSVEHNDIAGHKTTLGWMLYGSYESSNPNEFFFLGTTW